MTLKRNGELSVKVFVRIIITEILFARQESHNFFRGRKEFSHSTDGKKELSFDLITRSEERKTFETHEKKNPLARSEMKN